MTDLFVALGLVLVIEGLIYAAFPNAMRNMVNELAKLTDQNLRVFGLGAACAGLLVVWLFRG
jgi:uncharacterized protein YjeT (DUF2065 family)